MKKEKVSDSNVGGKNQSQIQNTTGTPCSLAIEHKRREVKCMVICPLDKTSAMHDSFPYYRNAGQENGEENEEKLCLHESKRNGSDASYVGRKENHIVSGGKERLG